MRDIDVKSYALGYDSGSKTGGGYPEPSGTKNISSNGDYNIKDYATAHVDVPQGITPTGTRTITQNGVYNVTEYASADVQVEESTTSLTDLNATANGTYNHDGYDGYDQVVVNVPNPSTGTLNITSNGDYDVTSKATAHVAVPEPTPVAPDLVDLTVTENGTYTHTGHDGYDEVVVNVPQGSTPTGSINITSNGTTDVTNYASAVVNVANTYSNSDEDKVVHNGALVTQTSTTVTSNGTIDTTTNNEVVVNVSSEAAGENVLRYNKVPNYTYRNVYDPSTTVNRQWRSNCIVGIPARSPYLVSCHLKIGNGIGIQTGPTMFTGFNYSDFNLSNSNVGLVKMPLLTTITADDDLWDYFPNATILGPFAYAGCTALTTAPPIHPSLGAIREYAFYFCESMQSITLPSTLRSIYEYAFYKCANLRTITIPENIYQILDYAFADCSRLQTVIFEGKPTNVLSSTAFSNCTNLTDIYVPWSNGEVAGAPWGATNATVHYNYSA